jgi:hypothetical protein
MEFWQHFASYKERGEWVELQFMAAAARRRFAVSWGDIRSYDVGIEHGENFLRVQVKSTTYRGSAGYLCQFKPNHLKKVDYSPKQLDLFAALRNSRGCLVFHPINHAARQTPAHHGDVMPCRATQEKGQLLL